MLNLMIIRDHRDNIQTGTQGPPELQPGPQGETGVTGATGHRCNRSTRRKE
jgi:hypothetical protein